MPQVILYPGPVTIHDSGNPDSDPSLFGSPPEWADDLDTSGAFLNTARRPSGTRTYLDKAFAALDLLTVPVSSVTAIHAEMRAKATSSPALPPTRPNPRASVVLYSGSYDPASFMNTYVNEFESITSGSEIGSWHIDDDGVTRDYTSPLGTLDGTVGAAASALASGCTVEVRRLGENEDTADHTLTVYELRVVVTYEGEEPARRGFPRCRRFPRGD